MKPFQRYSIAKNKLFVQFFLFFTLMFLAVLMLFGSFSYLYSKQIIDKKNERLYRSMITNAKEAIESRLRSLNDTSVFLLSDRRVQKLILEKDLDNSSLDIFEIVNDLKGISYTNPSIEHVSLYLGNADRVLKISGMEASADYLKSLYQQNYAGFEDILSNVPLWNHFYYLEPEQVVVNNRHTKAMTFIKTLTTDTSVIQAGVLFIINNSWLDEILPATDLNKHTYAFIRDSANHTIIAGSSALPAKEDTDPRNSFVFSEKIKDAPWEMTMVFPKSSIFFLKEYTRSFVIVMLLFIFAGLLLAFGLSFSNYRPVNRILRFIERNPDEKATELHLTDEYTRIRRYLENERERTAKLSGKLALHRGMYRDSSLSRLLTGMPIGRQDFKFMTEEHSFPEHHAGFLVIAYQIRQEPAEESVLTAEFAETFPSAGTSGSSNDQVGWALTEYAQSHAIHTYQLAGDTGKQLVLLCLSKEEQRAQLISDLQAIQRGFVEEKGIGLYVGVGTLVSTMDHIYLSCRQSVHALSFAAASGIHQVIEYETLSGLPPLHPEFMTYPHEFEAKLLNGFKMRDAAGITEMITTLVQERLQDVQDKALSLFALQCLYYELCAAMLRGVAALDPGYAKLDISYIEQHYSLMELHLYAAKALEKIGHSPNSEEGDAIEHQVYQFIEANYCKPKLTLNYIAEELNTSPYVISKSMRIDIQDYVNRKRIDYALHLLKEGSYSVGQISTMSGFTNENVFIRVFKRYEGITPGQYRKK
ncbi:helix-turn-helix transcriptional regulator [Paenibacillus eucommiae]|uniref:AraC-like DNA-binding protein n=1 Tax=Paenibacillus eucommiae TaxID=1355755 RepID=A0ABS4ILY0_9BACL|nr:helix-turn-helix domain-containing protein [Paenibacillus eucommiae]MBP1988569.1 AraC-like DNA-binding protein [Paenibacillus eucommiae]